MSATRATTPSRVTPRPSAATPRWTWTHTVPSPRRPARTPARRGGLPLARGGHLRPRHPPRPVGQQGDRGLQHARYVGTPDTRRGVVEVAVPPAPDENP